MLTVLLTAVSFAACVVEGEPDITARRSPLTIGGCTCPTSGTCATLTFSDIPADNKYYVTTFGGGSDTQGMACGGTADGTWAYVADKARFGCGAKLVVSAGGKQCVAQVADCGPNRCVEEAATYSGCASHMPILDASPFITKYLLGLSGVGYSDKKVVTAVVADPAATVGCPGTVPSPPLPPDSAPVTHDASIPSSDTGARDTLGYEDSQPPDRGTGPREDATLPPTAPHNATGGRLDGGCQMAHATPGFPGWFAAWLLLPWIGQSA